MQKILIVEDNIDNMDLLEAMLEANYKILKAFDGKAALRIIKSEIPNIILMDISLPKMDGVEVLKRIKLEKEFKSIPIIALTAHAMAGDEKKYLDIGFNGYISKPITDENKLFTIIANHLKK